jgi:nucleotide-binding universal stress UspA family protein
MVTELSFWSVTLRKQHPQSTAAAFLITAGIRRTPLLTLSRTMFNILLVPLDGSPQSVPVVDLASRVAAPGTATVHLLCVVDPSYALPPGCESGVAPDGLTYPPAHAQTSFAQSVLAAAAAQLADRNLTVEQHFCAGNPADVVIEQARLLTAEVIVMGHHNLSRLRRWANPSTCGQVIEKSPCAVLIETREKS